MESRVQTRILDNVVEITNFLAELGLTQEVLTRAMIAGEAARDSCTANHPPSAPGYYAWSETTRVLREILACHPYEWTKNDDANFSTVVSPDRRVALTVDIGDERAGRRLSLPPKTKYTKGPVTRQAVTLNAIRLSMMQPDLFESMSAPSEAGDIDGPLIWMLIRRRDGDTLFSELSLPDQVEESGRVVGWAARLIFEPIVLQPDPFQREDEPEEPENITVRWRS